MSQFAIGAYQTNNSTCYIEAKSEGNKRLIRCKSFVSNELEKIGTEPPPVKFSVKFFYSDCEVKKIAEVNQVTKTLKP